MDGKKVKETLRLRAHHVCCWLPLKMSFADRSPGFQQVESKIKNVLQTQPDAEVTVVEGVDVVCAQCPHCIDSRCTSPKGDETAVRKWDTLLLKELGVPFGTRMTVGNWQSLIRQKSPFKVCHRCRWHNVCEIGMKAR